MLGFQAMEIVWETVEFVGNTVALVSILIVASTCFCVCGCLMQEP